MEVKDKYYEILGKINDFKIKNKRSMTKEEAKELLSKEQDISFYEIVKLIKKAVNPIDSGVTLQRAFPLDMEKITEEQYSYLVLSLNSSIKSLFERTKKVNGNPSKSYLKHDINAIYALMEHFNIDDNNLLIKRFEKTFERNDNSFDDRVPKAIIYEDADSKIENEKNKGDKKYD